MKCMQLIKHSEFNRKLFILLYIVEYIHEKCDCQRKNEKKIYSMHVIYRGCRTCSVNIYNRYKKNCFA